MNNRDGTGIFRTLIIVEVLSEGPYEYEGLDVLGHDIVDGDCSGRVWTHSSLEYKTKEGVARALRKQGSDPEFLLGECWEEPMPSSDTMGKFYREASEEWHKEKDDDEENGV